VIVDLARASWRKSSKSGQNGGQCVEVTGLGGSNGVAVRDSKHPHGPVLALTAGQWLAFTRQVKARTFGLG
jgi:hypothetical protein